ncbi:MAG: hypothetical protein WCC10_10350 [Tumebacillaceae bacterium]
MNQDKPNHHKFDPEAVNALFQIDPANDLSDAQMVRRALFPRWEVIVPAEYDPIQEEDRIIESILEENARVEPVDFQNRKQPPVH